MHNIQYSQLPWPATYSVNTSSLIGVTHNSNKSDSDVIDQVHWSKKGDEWWKNNHTKT